MPKPVCFMIMPFGRKPTELSSVTGTNEVDFDRLWDLAFRPAIEELGYEAIRADADAGALIIQEMLERLAFADVVVADLTTSNGNVYYEIGVRHGLPGGCVMISAEGSRQLFDLSQMRQLRYPLHSGDVSFEDAEQIRRLLIDKLPGMTHAAGPFQQIGVNWRGGVYPPSFKTLVESLSGFQANISAINAAPKDARPAAAAGMLASYGAERPILASVAIELVRLLSSIDDFPGLLAFVASLPPEIQRLSFVREQRALALSGAGDDLGAIGELQGLIKDTGETSERLGLLGGRYKRLYRSAQNKQEKRRYLDAAIAAYERGMLLDLNDYFPAVNLPSLLRARGRPQDPSRARAIAQLVEIACEAAIARGLQTEWTKPSLLVAAFDAQNADKAEALAPEVINEPTAWKLSTTLQTLDASLAQMCPSPARRRLSAVRDELAAAL